MSDSHNWDEVLAEVSSMIEGGQITLEVLGGLAAEDIVQAMSMLVSAELTHLSGLSEDADANEEAMRQVMQNAAVKAFFVGLTMGREPASAMVSFPVSTEAMQALGLAAIRDGFVSINLYVDDE